MDVKNILAICDHTLLLQTATWDEIKEICDDAIKYQTASVCIPPCYVKQAHEYMGDAMKVCTVIGFPNGNCTTATKVFETKDAVANGAEEIDMVINVGMLKAKNYDYVLDEIKQIVAELAAQYGAKRVYLFGSCARGDMTDSSDIDLRIDKGNIKGFQLAGLLLDLEDSLGRPVDLVPTTSLDQRFLDAIRDDEVLLYEAS